ncbi:MAG: DNRLRE domain-containing protein [Anaerocolumna sp.]
MKKKTIQKTCAWVVMLTLLVGMVPTNTYAKSSSALLSAEKIGTNDLTSTIHDASNEPAENTTPPESLGEIESERSAYEKHFYMSDRSIQAVIYSEPVHYLEDGEWKEIDNTLALEQSQSSEDFTGYINTAGDFLVKIASDTGEENLVKIEKDKYTLQFKLNKGEVINPSEIVELDEDIANEEVEKITDTEEIDEEEDRELSIAPDDISESESMDTEETTVSPTDEVLVASVDNDTAIYTGIADNSVTDIEYKVTGAGLKENIIVNEKQDIYEYVFDIKADNLILELKNNEITAYDNKTREFVYFIPAPFMFDANDKLSDAVLYKLEKTETGYLFSITADSAWINGDDIKFPVTIDPVISTQQDGMVDTTFAASKTPAVNYSTFGSAMVGVDTANYNRSRTLLKIQMPKLGQGDVIEGAYLNILQYRMSAYTAKNPSMPINAHRITSNWNVSTVTWNTMPSIDSSEIDYNYINIADGNKSITKTFDITKAAKAWYDSDDTNFGIMLKAEKETGSNDEVAINANYYTEHNTNGAAFPVLVVLYRNSKGLEDYYSYTTVNAGSAGTAYVNNYTGNLVFSQAGVSTSGLKMPISVYPVYNVNNSSEPRYNSEQVSGFGWKLNIQQYIQDSAQHGMTGIYRDNYPYVYVDEDGTIHYLKKFVINGKTTYMDEDGLGLTMTKGSSSYTMKDSMDTVMTFASDGNLRSVTDSNGNTMTITYTDGIITSVTDGAGKKITISNSADKKITGITDSSGRLTKYFTYQGRLTKVTRPDGVDEDYEYNDKTLISVSDSMGYGVEFVYLSKDKGERVSAIKEFGVDKNSNAKAYGQQMVFNYADFATTKIRTSGADSIFDTSDDLVTTYRFDTYGRLISTQAKAGNSQLGTSLAKYVEVNSDNSNIKQANRISDSISMGANVNNLLKNHNGEDLTSWELFKNGTSNETIANSTFHHYVGSKSIKIGVDSAASGSSVRLRQMVENDTVVPGKTYTFSGYVKTVGQVPLVKGTFGAGLLVYCYLEDGSTTSYYSDYISSDTDRVINDGWRRLSVTFTVPANTIKTSVNLMQKSTNGSVYFDALQLEEGSTANDYNFLENASFENRNALYGYSTSNLILDGNTDKPIVGDSRFYMDGNTSFKITGAKDTPKSISQEVAVSGSEDDVYIISGWAKAYSVPAFIQGIENGTDRKFKISIKVTYTDNHFVWKTPAEFTPDVTLWQYGASIINLNDEDSSKNRIPKSITIYPRYDYQSNAAYFDNFSIIKDDAVSYVYDVDGNLISVKSSAIQKSNMVYSGSDLTNIKDAKGYDYKYTYDNYHNLKTATSQGNVKYTYGYKANNDGNPIQLEIQGGTMKILSDFTYTPGGTYLASVSDQDGYTTFYSYDENKGTLQSVTDADDNTINYTYHDNNDALTSVQATVGQDTITNSYLYENNMLKAIAHNDFQYLFNYDNFGNLSDVKVGNQVLAEYSYKDDNGDLARISYGNGDYKTFAYDAYGNLLREAANGALRYRWYSDNSGIIIKHEDLSNQLQYNYEYDTTERLIREEVIDISKPVSAQRNVYLTEYGYDANNNVNRFVNKAGSQTLVSLYGYIEDNLLSEYTLPSEKKVTFSYDSLNRLNKYIINTLTPIQVDYLYSTSQRNTDGGSTYRTMKIYQETVRDTGYRYSYDKLGNITVVQEKQPNGTYEIINSYEYDELNQLVRENDKKQNITKAYTYDLGGNIIRVDEYDYFTDDLKLGVIENTIQYEYGDNNWKDKLTSYNGETITYDAIGNPLSYNGFNLGWSKGRELSTLSGNGVTSSYTYDVDGLRTSKTVNGVTTTYQYIDGQLQYEMKGDIELHYLYDADGIVKGIRTVDVGGNTKDYYIITNSRGDVIQIYNESGALEAAYSYDSWGKLLWIKDAGGNEVTSDTHIGKLNSLRYRGYYYDTETKLYYLQSRYYDANIKRFLNTDSVLIYNKLKTLNLYSYCLNNPINMADPLGTSGIVYVAAGIAAMDGPLPIGDVIATGILIYAGGEAIYKSRGTIKKGYNNLLKMFSKEPSPSDWTSWKKSGNKWWNPKPNGIIPKVYVSTEALAKIYKKWGQKGVDAFTKAVQKGFVSARNQSGIKWLKNVYDFEIKVTNKEYGDWRIMGHINKMGEYVFDVFRTGFH